MKSKNSHKHLIEVFLTSFLAALQGRGWVQAITLSGELNLRMRELRALAEASEGKVISGNEGYKLTAEATPGEIAVCVGRLQSQAFRMTQRAAQLRAYAHEHTPNYCGV